jgi:lysophospholipase L1-like esterase
MPCVSSKSPERSGRAFCTITAIFLLVVLATFVFGLLHHSDQPQVFGRYSISYGLLLLGLFATAVYLVWVFWRGGARLQAWTANLYALLLSTLLVLLAVEWGLRVFNPFGVEFFHVLPYHMQGMVDDPRLGYRHPVSVTYTLGANEVTLNAHGLRDDEVPYDKPVGEKRILVLGDSVAFGWGVAQGETFSDRMEPLLAEQTGDRWQVINAGVNGYNTQQEATFLRIEGMRYSPDYVLLVYVSNDVDPVFDPNETTWRRYPSWPPSLPEAINRLRQLSYLFQTTHLFVRMEKMDVARAAAASIDNDALSRRDVRSMTDQPRWAKSKMALLDIARQCQQAGIPFLVGLYSSLDGGFDPAFVSELREQGIDAIHLQPAWRGVPESLAHVSRIDSHPSPLVHEKLAEYLVDVFQRRGWLEQP